MVSKLVLPGINWLDVGCGRSILPENPKLAKVLASRCGFLLGIDPDHSVNQNELLHARAAVPIEQLQTDRRFDLITLQMVAEHIANPESAVSRMAGLTRPGARVVVYTVHRWSFTSIVSAVTPMWVHHLIKHFLWRTASGETFPVVYRMNTQSRLSTLFGANGFRAILFVRLPFCHAFWRFRVLHFFELLSWKILNTVGVRYPENCILAVYERVGETVASVAAS